MNRSTKDGTEIKWPMDKILVKRKELQARLFCEKTAPQAKLIEENALQARFF